MNGDCLVMKNFEEREFIFQANNLNSTYFYHTKKGEIEYLQVEMKVCDEKIHEVNEKLSFEQLEKVFLRLLTTILNMKPINTT